MSFAQVCGWHVLENLYLPIFLYEIHIEICLFYTKCKASFKITGGEGCLTCCHYLQKDWHFITGGFNKKLLQGYFPPVPSRWNVSG